MRKAKFKVDIKKLQKTIFFKTLYKLHSEKYFQLFKGGRI